MCEKYPQIKKYINKINRKKEKSIAHKDERLEKSRRTVAKEVRGCESKCASFLPSLLPFQW